MMNVSTTSFGNAVTPSAMRCFLSCIMDCISSLRALTHGWFDESKSFCRSLSRCWLKLIELEEALNSTELDRMCLLRRLEEEKAGCPDELVFQLLWDHFYLGLPWKRTGLRHGMKESATKMRALRFLKTVGVCGSAGEQAGMTLGEPPE